MGVCPCAASQRKSVPGMARQPEVEGTLSLAQCCCALPPSAREAEQRSRSESLLQPFKGQRGCGAHPDAGGEPTVRRATKVAQFDAAVLVEKSIAGLDVSVQEPGCVHVQDSLRQLQQDGQDRILVRLVTRAARMHTFQS